MQVLSITLTDKSQGIRETIRVERESVKDLHENIIQTLKRQLRFEKEDEEEAQAMGGLQPGQTFDITKMISEIVDKLSKEPIKGQPVEEKASAQYVLQQHRPTKHRIPKVKVIVCHGCGDIVTGKFETRDTFECRSCNSTQAIEDNYHFGEYNCTCCGTSAFLGLTPETYEYVTCRHCQAPIDMTWHTKDLKYVSLNMLGK